MTEIAVGVTGAVVLIIIIVVIVVLFVIKHRRYVYYRHMLHSIILKVSI